MEAVAVLSLACNVIQVVESAIKVGHTIQETYRKGNSQRNIDANSTANHLSSLSEELLKDLNSTTTTATPTTKRLKKIGQECYQISLDLVRKTQKLQAGNPGKLGAFTKGIRTAWKKGDIDKLVTKLQDHERLLNTAILVDLRRQYELSSILQQKSFKSLSDKQQSIIQNISDSQKHITDLVTDEEVLTRNSIKDNHRETQAVVKDEVSMTRSLVVTGNDQVLALGVNIDSKHQRSIDVQQRERLLDSLYSPEMKARMNQTSLDGYPDTCDYIFTNTNPVSFSGWLEHGNGIFWIQGKAGSGKSTMMKFIFEDKRTTEYLTTWSSQRQPMILSFFFWLSGSSRQNTLHGLLCSLMHQLLQADEAEITEVFSRCPQVSMKKQPHDWSQKELLSQLNSSIDRVSQCSPIFIMLDGLDELGGKDNPRELLDIINKWVNHARVKICVASRSENVFIGAFEEVPSVRLQNLNKSSIRKYVENELIIGAEKKFGYPEVEQRVRNGLVYEISRKADGVFIWVRIAVNDLLDALTDAADWSELERRVESLSPDIEQLYQGMLQRKQVNLALAREEAALYFKLALSGGEDITSSILFYEISSSVDVYAVARAVFIKREASSCFEAYRSAKELGDASRKVILRIRSLCAGLLECIPWDQGGSIHFSHRTARDFLSDSVAGQNILKSCGLTASDLLRIYLETLMIQYKLGFRCLDWDEVATLAYAPKELREEFPISAEQSHMTLDVISADVSSTATLLRYIELKIPEMMSAPSREKAESYNWTHIHHNSSCPKCEYVVAGEWRREYTFAIDFAGLALERGVTEHFQRFWAPLLQANSGRGVQLTQEYKNYLLFCAMKRVAYVLNFDFNFNIADIKYYAKHLTKLVAVIRQLLAAGAKENFLFYLPLHMSLRQCLAVEAAVMLWNLHKEPIDIDDKVELAQVMNSMLVSDADLRMTGLIGIDKRRMQQLERRDLDPVEISLLLEVNVIWILRSVSSPSGGLQELINRSGVQSFCRLIRNSSWVLVDIKDKTSFGSPPALLEDSTQPCFAETFEGRHPSHKDFVLNYVPETYFEYTVVWRPTQRICRSCQMDSEYKSNIYEVLNADPKIDIEQELKSLGYLKDPTDSLVPQGPIKRFEDYSEDGKDMTEEIAALNLGT